MTEKLFFIDSDGSTIGIYFQERLNRLTIGGLSRFFHLMDLLMVNYFLISDYQVRKTAKNKMKLVGKCNLERFNEGLRVMKIDRLTIQRTINFNRIWW